MRREAATDLPSVSHGFAQRRRFANRREYDFIDDEPRLPRCAALRGADRFTCHRPCDLAGRGFAGVLDCGTGLPAKPTLAPPHWLARSELPLCPALCMHPADKMASLTFDRCQRCLR